MTQAGAPQTQDSTHDRPEQLEFTSLGRTRVQAVFDEPELSSDAGALVIRETADINGIIDEMTEAIRDERDRAHVRHTVNELLTQRVVQICHGYEDANDCDALRCDPAFKAAVDRLPLSGMDLASQPTMSRLENRVSRTDLYRMARALVDTFIASYDRPPEAILLDIDDTDDPTHGAQQLTLFNGYYQEKCYLGYQADSGKNVP